MSNDTAFAAAGADAVHEALRDNIVLLEPWMRVEVEVRPEPEPGKVRGWIGGNAVTILRGELEL